MDKCNYDPPTDVELCKKLKTNHLGEEQPILMSHEPQGSKCALILWNIFNSLDHHDLMKTQKSLQMTTSMSGWADMHAIALLAGCCVGPSSNFFQLRSKKVPG